MIDKAKVAKLYGTPEMVAGMAKGKPNAFVLLALENIDIRGLSILELCCGTGYITNALAQAGADCTGVDISPEAIKYAQAHAHPNASFICRDIEELIPQPDYDLILIPFGLQYMKDPYQVVKTALESLKFGGKLVVADAYKVGARDAITGIPGQMIDMVKFGLSHGVPFWDILKLILGSLGSFSLFGLKDWKQLEEIRRPLVREQIHKIAADFCGKYTQIGNSYFVIEFDLQK